MPSSSLLVRLTTTWHVTSYCVIAVTKGRCYAFITTVACAVCSFICRCYYNLPTSSPWLLSHALQTLMWTEIDWLNSQINVCLIIPSFNWTFWLCNVVKRGICYHDVRPFVYLSHSTPKRFEVIETHFTPYDNGLCPILRPNLTILNLAVHLEWVH